MNIEISKDNIHEWKQMTDLNQHTDVRIEICNHLSKECERNGKHDMFKCFREVYEAIESRSAEWLSFEDSCMRIGCDEKMMAMVKFLDSAAAETINYCL